ncbi:hypothetical protein DAPPUDRAFT_245225 [Daphnia pulex]|uniref:Uncharacterized protein n=1 Tax=Daphnia pulex TaxID=6669 RepID=E9GMT9_DAPPU|nr:hypothetical protein DAPPUDRAFT_245225 [Daphnia pulex]|eukprot:EFX79150.1 hypothetical protein DAPPUDRAFT_245225 [Daphnia pulex]
MYACLHTTHVRIAFPARGNPSRQHKSTGKPEILLSAASNRTTWIIHHESFGRRELTIPINKGRRRGQCDSDKDFIWPLSMREGKQQEKWHKTD